MKYELADIAAQIRAMGRTDRAAGKTACPFAPKSNAARLWREGWRQGWEQMGLFEQEAA